MFEQHEDNVHLCCITSVIFQYVLCTRKLLDIKDSHCFYAVADFPLRDCVQAFLRDEYVSM